MCEYRQIAKTANRNYQRRTRQSTLKCKSSKQVVFEFVKILVKNELTFWACELRCFFVFYSLQMAEHRFSLAFKTGKNWETSSKLKLRLRKLVSILKSLKLFNFEIKEDDSIFRVLILVKPTPKLNFTTIENKTFCKNEK